MAVFVQLPATVYFGNRAEFAGSPAEVLGPFWWCFGLAGTALAVALSRLGGRARERTETALLVAGLLATVQGSVLVHQYGRLTGVTALAGRPRDAVVDAVVLSGLLLALVALRRPLLEHRRFAAGALAAWLAAGTAAAVVEATPPAAGRQVDFAAITAVSSGRNVFHLMLDSYQPDVFPPALGDDPAARERLSGFTFYPDQAAYSNWTLFNFGPMWAREGLFDRPLAGEQVWDRARETLSQGLPAILAAHGVHVALVVPDPRLCIDGAAACRTLHDHIADTLRRERRGWLSPSADMLFVGDLTLFRLAPAPLKPLVHGHGRWTLSRLAASGRGSLEEALEMNVMERQVPRSLEFFRRQTASLAVATAQPAYHFIHVFPPHPPLVLDADCRPRPLTTAERRVQWRHRPRERYAAQARCAWQAVEEFLARLRALGLYDSSGILVESDHGLGVVAEPGEEAPEPFVGMPANRVRAYANPLLLVKPPYAAGPMRTSHAPTSHFDSAPTVLRWFGVDHPLARHPGYMEVPMAAERPRRFALSGQIGEPPGEQAFHLMTIEGPIRQAASWKSAGIYSDAGRPYERTADLPLPGFALSQ
jgi:hypothetical protein